MSISGSPGHQLGAGHAVRGEAARGEKCAVDVAGDAGQIEKPTVSWATGCSAPAGPTADPSFDLQLLGADRRGLEDLVHIAAAIAAGDAALAGAAILTHLRQAQQRLL